MKCAICEKRIKRQYICEDCKEQYRLGNKYADWPEWVKELIQAERIQAREDSYVDAYAGLDDERWIYDENGGWHTRAMPMSA